MLASSIHTCRRQMLIFWCLCVMEDCCKYALSWSLYSIYMYISWQLCFSSAKIHRAFKVKIQRLHELGFCCSRKYLYPPHERFFGFDPPPPLWQFQFSFIFSFKILGLNWVLTPPHKFQWPFHGVSMDSEIFLNCTFLVGSSFECAGYFMIFYMG